MRPFFIHLLQCVWAGRSFKFRYNRLKNSKYAAELKWLIGIEIEFATHSIKCCIGI